MRYCEESRLDVANETSPSTISGRGEEIRRNCCDRKIQLPFEPATSKSAPFAQSPASLLSSSRSLLSPRKDELAKTRRRTVSRFVREALSTVASILRWKPRSLTQKKATNDRASTKK